MWNIAINTFREYTRNHFWSLLILCSCIFPVLLIFFGEISLQEFAFVVPTVGLSFIEIIVSIFLVFIGSRLLVREFEEKTLYLLLTRPIRPTDIIFGKFLGFSVIIGIFFGVLSMILVGLMMVFNISFSAVFFMALLGIFLKIITLLSLLLLLSVFVSSGILMFLLLAIYIIGHSGYFLLQYGLTHWQGFYIWFAKIILFIFPNFSALNFRENIYDIAQFSWGHAWQIVIFSLVYISIVLLLARWFFLKKSFDLV